MRIGLNLGVDLPPDPQDLINVVATAESLGFSSFWLSDHVIIPRKVDDSAHRRDVGGETPIADKSLVDIYEPIVTMAYLAANAHRIRLGFSVLVIPYRNPVLAAKMLSTIDVLSGGRVMLGAGVGWMEDEFTALGASYSDRGRVTDEYLSVMRECWTRERPEFHGRHYNLEDIVFRPKPVQEPHVPIYVGGNGDVALRRTASLGQGWLPLFQSPAELEPKIARLHDLWAESGRDANPRVIASVRARLRSEDDLGSVWSERDPAAVRDTVAAYEAVGVDELTLVMVEPDLDLGLLDDALHWFANELIGESS